MVLLPVRYFVFGFFALHDACGGVSEHPQPDNRSARVSTIAITTVNFTPHV